jgi:hypothetical protein
MKFARLALLLMTPLARTPAAESAAPERAPEPAPPATAPAAAGDAASSAPVPKPAAPKSAPARKSSLPPISRDVLRDSFNLAELRDKAANGNAIAQYNLGLAYAEGRGVRADPIEAFAWLSLASEKGSTGKAFERLLGTMSNAQLSDGSKRLTAFRSGVFTPPAPRPVTPAAPAAAPVREINAPPPLAAIVAAAPAPSLTPTPQPDPAEPVEEDIIPLFRARTAEAPAVAPAAAAGTVVGASLSRATNPPAGGAAGAPASAANAAGRGTPGAKSAATPGTPAAATAGEPPSGAAAALGESGAPAAAGMRLAANVPPEVAQRQIEAMAKKINEKGLLPAQESARAKDPAALPPPRNRIDLDPSAQPAVTGDDAKPDPGSAHLAGEIDKAQTEAAARADSPSAASANSGTNPAGAPSGAAPRNSSRTAAITAGATGGSITRSPGAGASSSAPSASSSGASGTSSVFNSDTIRPASGSSAATASAAKPPALVRAENALAVQSRELATARADAEKARLALNTERTRAGSLAATASAQAAALAEEQRRSAAAVTRLAAERDALLVRLNQSGVSVAPSAAAAPTDTFDPLFRPNAERENLASRLAQTQSALSSEISARTQALQSAQSASAELAAARARIDDLTARTSAPGARSDPDAPRFRSELSELRAYLDRTTATLITRLEQTEAATLATADTQSKTGSQLTELRNQLANATAQAAASTNAATTSATALAEALAKVDSLAAEKLKTADTLVQLRTQLVSLETALAAEKTKSLDLSARDDAIARLTTEKADLAARLAKAETAAKATATALEASLARELAIARQESAAREAELTARLAGRHPAGGRLGHLQRRAGDRASGARRSEGHSAGARTTGRGDGDRCIGRACERRVRDEQSCLVLCREDELHRRTCSTREPWFEQPQQTRPQPQPASAPAWGPP